ncbi:PREDICTED: flexible cuticle protein 12-like [Papilio polytes]|uniref:flexible cuticle protein 12-like n=1 Tax=Papilio polytes TaxID=76194 RepID=UPI000675C485|nr:PREDICTED: flexible cuticle protein 12-like [Papilio polytes]
MYKTFILPLSFNEQSTVKMKLVVLLCLLGIVYAVPAPSFLDSVSDCYDNEDKFLRFDNFRRDYYNSQRIAYRFGFEQLDGTKQEQEGQFINKGGDDFLSVNGFYSYIGSDGVRYTTKYKADDNGYQPVIEQGPGGSVPDAVVASMLG